MRTPVNKILGEHSCSGTYFDEIDSIRGNCRSQSLRVLRLTQKMLSEKIVLGESKACCLKGN